MSATLVALFTDSVGILASRLKPAQICLYKPESIVYNSAKRRVLWGIQFVLKAENFG